MNDILRYAIIIYYCTHIPITLCLDLQGLLHAYFPPALQQLLQWYVRTVQSRA